MRDIRVTHPALILCYRIVCCAKPVPTFAHDALIVCYRIVCCAKPVPTFAHDALICPITHTEPEAGQTGIELGPKDRAWMGLDDKPQWIITSEANVVDWADPGIIPVPDTGDWAYGIMSAELATQVQAEARKNLSEGQLALVSRIEKAS